MSMQSRWNRAKSRVNDMCIRVMEDDFEEEHPSPDEPDIPVDPTQDAKERQLKSTGDGHEKTAQWSEAHGEARSTMIPRRAP